MEPDAFLDPDSVPDGHRDAIAGALYRAAYYSDTERFTDCADAILAAINAATHDHPLDADRHCDGCTCHGGTYAVPRPEWDRLTKAIYGPRPNTTGVVFAADSLVNAARRADSARNR